MMRRKVIPICWCLALPGLMGCAQQDASVFQGYVEGEYVYLASSRAGRLESLLTERGALAEAGALLFALEAESERHAVQQAEEELRAAQSNLRDMESGRRPEEVAVAQAQLAQAEAEAEHAASVLRRYEALAKTEAATRQEYEDAVAAAKSAAARVAELSSQVEVFRLPEREKRIEAQQAAVQAAEARAAQARWELAEKQVHAPAAGRVFDTLFRVGEWVPAGGPVVQLLPPGNIKIRFFVPEAAIGGIHVGDAIRVAVDGRNGLDAVVTFVAAKAEYTPPVIYSNETRAKLVFMVEARPAAEAAASLHPGQPVSVSRP